MIKTIGLITNFEKEQAEAVVTRVAKMAYNLGFAVFASPRAAALHTKITPCEISQFSQNGVEAIIVLGGDGTMLDAAHKVAAQQLPMMGLNIGSLGYLTSVTEHQFADALRMLQSGEYRISKRSALAVAVQHEKQQVKLPDALNDVVISRGASGRAVVLEVLLECCSITRMLCDGIIISTPTGSTAYSLSCGGPILLPDTPALVINLICPHTLTARPLVVRDTTHISIRAVECEKPLVVSQDGQIDEPLFQGEQVEVQLSDTYVPLIELHGYNPCEVLRRKLGWAVR